MNLLFCYVRIDPDAVLLSFPCYLPLDNCGSDYYHVSDKTVYIGEFIQEYHSEACGKYNLCIIEYRYVLCGSILICGCYIELCDSRANTCAYQTSPLFE